MAKGKRYADATWDDVVEVVKTHVWQEGMTIRLEIYMTPVWPGKVHLEVRTWGWDTSPSGAEAYVTRHPLDLKHPERFSTQVMRAVFDHTAKLENDPWYWPKAKRMRAKEE